MALRQRAAHRFSRASEQIIEWAIRLCGWSAIFFVFSILFFVFREAAPALGEGLSLKEFFTSQNWRPDSTIQPQFGIVALLAGTVAVTALAMAIAVPAGLGAAIFVSEYCGSKTREALKIVIEFLAAIPSVVWGFIGAVVLNPIITQTTGAPIGINVLNGAIILALMSVPIIMSVGEDAFRAVPDTYREAAVSLGASRWQIVYKVLLPAAKSGLLAAVLLGVGRAVGETMAVLMATGHSVAIPDIRSGSGAHVDRHDRGRTGRNRGGRIALPRALRHRQSPHADLARGESHRRSDRQGDPGQAEWLNGPGPRSERRSLSARSRGGKRSWIAWFRRSWG